MKPKRSIAIKINQLDQKTIHWLDNSGLRTHLVKNHYDCIVSNLLKESKNDNSLFYLIWNLTTQSFGLYNLAIYVYIAKNLQDFQKEIGMINKNENSDWKEISFEEAKNSPHGTELKIQLTITNQEIIGFRCKDFHLQESIEGSSDFLMECNFSYGGRAWKSNKNEDKFNYGCFVYDKDKIFARIKTLHNQDFTHFLSDDIHPNYASVFKRTVSFKEHTHFSEISLGNPQLCILGTDWTTRLKDESYLEKIKRRIKSMFTQKTIVKEITLHEIHSDILPDVGRSICDAVGAKYKEVEGRIVLIKAGMIPVQLTSESASKLLTDKIKGKPWEDVRSSNACRTISNLGLLNTIQLQNVQESLEDLF